MYTQGQTEYPLLVNLDFRRLSEVKLSDLVGLMTDPRLHAHMPLLSDRFDEQSAEDMIREKEAAWSEHGYGLWAFYVDGRFVGWGGLQCEQGDPDLAIVLHPDAWGGGRDVYCEIVKRGFEDMDFDYITILLPPTRTKLAAIERLGFERREDVEAHGETFMRFMLTRIRHRTLVGRGDHPCKSNH